MNYYSGKRCPYCKTEFRPGEDIVVCSECDMPHHKECWIENQGCTTFGCLGTIKGADNVENSVTTSQMQYEDFGDTRSEEFVYCTKCGAPNATASIFCSYCGNRIMVMSKPEIESEQTFSASGNSCVPRSENASYQSRNGNLTGGDYEYWSQQATGIDLDLLQQLIGRKDEYYLPRYETMKTMRRYASWNWAAFLATPLWLVYRKMYAYAVAVLCAGLMIGLANSTLLSLLELAGYVMFGIFGNSIYLRSIEAKAMQANVMSEPYRSQFIKKKGGVNILATILIPVGYLVLYFIMWA